MEPDTTGGDLTELASGIYLEGLAVDHRTETIWYSDVIAGGIHGVRADGTKVAVLDPERCWTGGIMMNADGAVLSSGQGGIRWNHPGTGRSGWLLDSIAGQPISGVNEMWPDGEGGLYFGTIDMDNIIAARPTRPVALYRLRCDGTIALLADGLRFTNGIACNPGLGQFYCSATFDAAYAWDIAADGSLTNRRVLLPRNDCDGLAIDVEDSLWIPGVYSPGIVRRVTPSGRELAPFLTPPGATTQIRFGGADGRDLYLAMVPADAGEALRTGAPLSGTSRLLRMRSEVAGVKIAPAAFALD